MPHAGRRNTRRALGQREIWTIIPQSHAHLRTEKLLEAEQALPQALSIPSGTRIELILPLFSVNDAWLHVHARRVNTPAYRAFKGRVAQVVHASWPQDIPRPLTGRVALAGVLIDAGRGTHDIDAPIKPSMDALTEAGVWRDDRQVDALSMQRGARGDIARLELTIILL